MDILESGLQKLIEFLETASPELWRILVREQVMSGVRNAIWAVICAVIIAVSAYWIVRVVKGKEWRYTKTYVYLADEEYIKDEGNVILAIAGVLGGTSLVAFPLLFSSAMALLMNPEYHAIKSILYMLK